jgi:hypothetical protein
VKSTLKTLLSSHSAGVVAMPDMLMATPWSPFWSDYQARTCRGTDDREGGIDVGAIGHWLSVIVTATNSGGPITTPDGPVP